MSKNKTAAECRMMEYLSGLDIAVLCDAFDKVDPSSEVNLIVRECIMVELEKRNAVAFEAWIENNDNAKDSPRFFFC